MIDLSKDYLLKITLLWLKQNIRNKLKLLDTKYVEQERLKAKLTKEELMSHRPSWF
jgi:hypothetical protein